MFEKHIQKVRGNDNIVAGGNVTVTYGISPDVFAQYVQELGETKQVIRGFFSMLLEHEVPRDQWGSKLLEIAATHKELRLRLETMQSEEPPSVKHLKQAAHQAIEQGRFADAETLLKAHIQGNTCNNTFFNSGGGEQNIAQGDGAIGKQVNTYNITQPVSSDDLQELLKLVAQIKEWLPEQMPNEPRQCTDTATALPYLEQSLAISQEIGDRAKEGAALNNIGQIYYMQGDYATALRYLEQSLAIYRMIGDKASEAAILSNIAQLHYVRATKP